MGTGNVKHISQRSGDPKRVFFKGTETINRGDVLCYDQDATENGTTNEDQLGLTVERPATANLKLFAGYYTGEEGSFTGPGFITMNTPVKGEMVEMNTDANMTVNATILGPQDGSFALAALTAATAHENGAVAVAGVTEDTDTVNALSTVYIMS